MERKTAIQSKEMQPTKCKDLIQPKEEESSINSKGAPTNQKYFLREILVKSRTRPRESDEKLMGPIIKDLIINQE